MKNRKVFKNLEDLSQFAAKQFVMICKRSIKANGRFNIVLAGGSTPKNLYQLLASEEFRDLIDWEKVFFFFGDERDVSPMSDLSNFRMADENLLKPLEIPATNVIRWRTEIIDSVGVAEAYEKTLRTYFELANGAFPKFDLLILGMGDDGHTASLFPQSKGIGEAKKLAVSNFVEKLDANRLTLTFPVLNSATNILVLVSGDSKAEALKEVLEGDKHPEKFPAQKIKPVKGKLIWVLDEEAAKLLKKR